jgi:hypothetical protein
VLAVKDECADALAACGGLTILDCCARRDPGDAGNPAQASIQESTMDTFSDLSVSRHANAFSKVLSLDEVRQRAPAVFATTAHERTSSAYTFIPTERVLDGLMQAGFVPVDARQTRSRYGVQHARHIVRLRRRFETVQLRDSVPEVLFLNSHDGTSAYQLRVGIFRVICTNGLIVSLGAFPSIRVSHRGNVVDDVVAGALEMSERFGVLAGQVERMEQRNLSKEEQVAFAEQALRLRYADIAESGMQPSQLLNSRRVEDLGSDVWSTLNKVQENLLRGGMVRRSVTGRLTRSRRITSIREDVRLNSRLWDLAAEVLVA